MTVDLLYVGTNLDPGGHRRFHVRLSVQARLIQRDLFARDVLHPPIIRRNLRVARVRLAARHAVNHRLKIYIAHRATVSTTSDRIFSPGGGVGE